MSSRYKNSGNDRPKNTGFNLKRILYLMAHSQIVSSKSHGDDSWQRSLCYSNKNFNSFPRDMLLLYRRMAAVFESHWTRIQTLTIYQVILILIDDSYNSCYFVNFTCMHLLEILFGNYV